MQLILPIIVIVIVAGISIFSGKKATSIPIKTQSPVSTQNPTPTVLTPTPTQNENSKVTIIIKNNTLPSSTPTPSASSSFIYPGASVKSNSNGEIILASYDNPNQITDWYKDKIKSEGMNTTSFVVTNTNENIENVLAGANKTQEVKINITKKSDEKEVLIRISIKNS